MKTQNSAVGESGKKAWVAPAFELIDVKTKSDTRILKGFRLLDPDDIHT